MSCPDCFRGGKAVGTPKGTIQTLHGVPTYITEPATPSPSGSTIIYYTDIFGLRLVNNKVLADAYAASTGLRVLVPDIIPGGAASPTILPLMDKITTPVRWFDILGQISRAISFVRAIAQALPVMIRARPGSQACFASCLEYTRQIKADLPPGGKLGLAGFCWGGYPSLNLSAQPAVEGGSERLVDAQFCAHPSFLKMPDHVVNAAVAFKTPIAIAFAEKDMAISMAKVDETEAALRRKAGSGEGENGYFYELRTYKRAAHGFAVRAKPGEEVESKAADEAVQQAVDWFKRWLRGQGIFYAIG